MEKIIETRELVTNFYTYEGVVKALNKVSLAVQDGITFGLVGESGCGKSVFVRSLMRIIQAPGKIDGGEILLYSDDNQNAPVDLLKQSNEYMQNLRGCQISMIFQEPNAALNPLMSIGNQVAESYMFHQRKSMSTKILQEMKSASDKTLFFLKPYYKIIFTAMSNNPRSWLLRFLEKIPIVNCWKRRLKKEAITRSIEILKLLHISNPEQVVDYYPHNLSGGMKQRIVIAIALACSPLLLIADEPTSNLDVTIQAQILNLLRELKKTAISSILFITHDLGVVAETCDKVGVMYAGNLCELADVKVLFHSPLHPYAKALLDAVPKFSQEGRLESIEGNVPNLVNPPSGCRFNPRCPHRMDVCSQTFPDLIEYSKDHFVACHYISRQKGK